MRGGAFWPRAKKKPGAAREGKYAKTYARR